MEVILQENYPSLGYVGDRVNVKGGFARNFLIPRGIAIEASSRNERVLKHRLQHVMAKRIRLKSEAEALGKQLAEAALEFTLKMGEAGKSFGSITSRDIETALKAKGFEIDRKQVRMTESLRKAGEFKVSVKLHAEVIIAVPVKVISEAPPVSAEGKEARKGRGRKKDAEAAAEGTEAPEAVEAAAAEGEKPKAKKRAKKAEKAEASEE
ncbi:MAG: 50S ribosomal protein L9 [Deltaproteobacteria bacterium]|nr:50S ribosomal protein L9 [Deltaproteobacteria bacterium]